MDSNNIFSNFISSLKSNLNSDKCKWLVLGNESSDLDSVVCSLAYSIYKQSIVGQSICVLPVICIQKENIILKKDVVLWLRNFNIDVLADLIYLEDVALIANVTFCENLRITLVDHHKPNLELLSQYVTEIIDHRELSCDLNPNHLTTKNIRLVGSCSTLIASYIINESNLLSKSVLLKLLYGAILLDTDCLINRTTELDIQIVEQIEEIVAISKDHRNEIYKMLFDAKANVSDLTLIQTIRRDLKTINVKWNESKIKIAIPTLINTDVQDIISIEGVGQQLSEILTNLDVSVLIMLTCGTQSLLRRGYIIFSHHSELSNKISQYLLLESKFTVERYVHKADENILAFIENDMKMTRKILIPLIEKCFSHEYGNCYKGQCNNCNIHWQLDDIDTNIEEELENEGAPYTLSTPRCSCSGSPDTRNTGMNLPSLNNRHTLALIDKKRQKHNLDLDVVEDIVNDDSKELIEDDVSPLAYTPDNSDEDDESNYDDVGPLPSLNTQRSVKQVNCKPATLLAKTTNDLYSPVKSPGSNSSFTSLSNTSEYLLTLQDSDDWNNEFTFLTNEVDKKRQKLATDQLDLIANVLVGEVIIQSEKHLEQEKFYGDVLTGWSGSYTDQEKMEFIQNLNNNDTLKVSSLLTTGLIRDCITEFEHFSLEKNPEINNSAVAKDVVDNPIEYPINENSESDEEQILPDSTIPDLEINYNNCPIGTIINKDVQCVSNAIEASNLDVENSSFNLYRRISNNQLDFSEDEKRLLSIAGNWCPEEDIIYSDGETEPNSLIDNETDVDHMKKIIYPNQEITTDMANLETVTSTEISLCDLDLMHTPDLNMIGEREDSEKSEYSYSCNQEVNYDSTNFNVTSLTSQIPNVNNLYSEYNVAFNDSGCYLDVTNNNLQTKIITMYSCYLPEKTNEKYHEIMEHIFNYSVNCLENIDTDCYTLVYFHCCGNQKKVPTLSWLYQYYQTINYKLKKNVKHLYIVQPTIWLKAIMFFCHFFINSKVYSKIHYISELENLAEHLPLANIKVPI